MGKAIVFLFIVMMVVPQSVMGQSDDDPLLKSLGASLAGNLYFAYMSIGSIADGFEKKVYTAQNVADLMEANNNLLDSLTQVLRDSTGEYEYAESDIGFIESTIDILDQLKKLANTLVKYTKDKAKKTADEFAKIKDSAWADISSLLGIE